MRTYTTKHTVYRFDELSEEIKQKALEKLYDINIYDDWHEFIIDEAKEYLESIGFNDVNIQYSGFWSQGDGASFTGKLVYTAKFLKAMKLGNKYKSILVNQDYIDASIDSIDSHYCHENTIRGNANNYYADNYLSHKQVLKLEKQCEEFEEYLTDWAREYSHELYRRLEREYDYLTSEEAIIETINANEYEFDVNGGLA